MVICLEWVADLHTALLMPLPLTVSCLSKIKIGFTFLVLAQPVIPLCHEHGMWLLKIQVPTVLLSGNNLGQVVHTHVPVS